MSFSRLPRELSDMVLDNLHDDKPSLNSCSRVARGWTAGARYHLFSCVRLQFTRGNQSTPASNLESFLDEGHAVWKFVREICVFNRWDSPPLLTPSSLLAVKHNLLQTIIQSLPNLQSLTFFNVNGGRTPALFFG